MKATRTAVLCAACAAAGVVAGRLSVRDAVPGGAPPDGRVPREGEAGGDGAVGSQGPERSGAAASRDGRPPAAAERRAGTTASAAEREAEDRDLAARLERAEAEVRDLRERLAVSGPRARYDSATAEGRRRLAARGGKLLLEIPASSERGLPDEALAGAGLNDEQRRDVQEAYERFQADLTTRLRGLHATLSGNPDAGRGASISTLLHGITDLTPGGACREAMRALVSALAAGTPLPAAQPDSGCGDLSALVWGSVDALERSIADRFGEAAVKALWSNSSTFEYSTAP